MPPVLTELDHEALTRIFLEQVASAIAANDFLRMLSVGFRAYPDTGAAGSAVIWGL
jgi:hypothetical protein